MDWNICVMAQGETVFANTEGQKNGFTLIAPGALSHVGRLLRDIGESFWGNDEGLLLVPTLPATLDEDDYDATHAWDMMHVRAAENQWRTVNGRGSETGWITWTHEISGKKIHMGVLSLMDQSRTPLFSLDAPAPHIVQALLDYHHVTGALWRMTAGVSGCVGIRTTIAASIARDNARADRESLAARFAGKDFDDKGTSSEPHWRWDEAPETLHGLGHMVWLRELAPAERHLWIYTFDVRAQFLAAMAAARLGWGKPAHQKQPIFDPTRAGYWRIPAFPWADRPPLLDTKKIDKWGTTWVTTPAMVYLDSLGVQPAASESWTTATSSQILKPWATELRKAIDRRAAEGYYVPLSIEAIKRTYTETIGMFTVPGGSIYRPDWRDTIIDMARVNMMRKLDRARQVLGMWPCKIYHDAVSYAGSETDQGIIGTALAVGPNIGKFKYVNRMPAIEYVRRADPYPRRERSTNG